MKLQPKYPFGHYLLELLYFDTGETVRAIPELETALRLAPQEPQFYFELGNAYVKAGRKQEAARARASFIRLQRREGSESGHRVRRSSQPRSSPPAEQCATTLVH